MNRLKEIRIDKKMSQRELANKMNTTPASISRYEYQDQRLTIPILKKFSQVLNVSISEIIGEFNHPRLLEIPIINKLEGKKFIHIDKDLPFIQFDDDLFGFVILDDSMAPTLKQDDVVIFKSVPKSFRSNGLVVLKTDSEYFLARANWNPLSMRLNLTTENPEIADYGEIDPNYGLVEIIGTAVWFMKKAN